MGDTSAVSLSSDGVSAAAGGSAGTWCPPGCRVPGCQEPLEGTYCKKYRICRQHYSSPVLDMGPDEPPSRFCQQCSKIHPLSEFDGAKLSCREGLARHTQRRRERQLRQQQLELSRQSAPRARRVVPRSDSGIEGSLALLAAGDVEMGAASLVHGEPSSRRRRLGTADQPSVALQQQQQQQHAGPQWQDFSSFQATLPLPQQPAAPQQQQQQLPGANPSELNCTAATLWGLLSSASPPAPSAAPPASLLPASASWEAAPRLSSPYTPLSSLASAPLSAPGVAAVHQAFRQLSQPPHAPTAQPQSHPLAATGHASFPAAPVHQVAAQGQHAALPGRRQEPLPAAAPTAAAREAEERPTDLLVRLILLGLRQEHGTPQQAQQAHLSAGLRTSLAAALGPVGVPAPSSPSRLPGRGAFKRWQPPKVPTQPAQPAPPQLSMAQPVWPASFGQPAGGQ